ncbi:IclR family transcriptional regulator [Nonomuraea sp. NBC_01738]|uniref:IclR family transcriptional regulator n=1 Tax=Nonomuraea sp. NBC_01738 TaxID=2976003 RepID=UPI002E0D4F27|nr:IclR family transcriptional regulator [Nonomuraea sp. NBC_01738]
MRDSGTTSQTVATVERAADVLVRFAEPGTATLGVTELADSLGMSKAAVHRVLASLRSRGLVELDEDSRRYSLGLTAMRLGLAYLDRIDIRGLAGPELAGLSARTGETATLSIRTGRARVYIDQVTPPREVIMSVRLGEPHPLHAGASSKAFLAFLPEEEIAAYLADSLEQVTPATVTDPGKLATELALIRRRGYAMSISERKSGAASVAAPVLDHHGLPAAVVSVSGPAERFIGEADACASALLETTDRLSARLGSNGRS